MKPENDISSVAQGAAEWKARKRHEEIMKRIGKVRGWTTLEEDYDQYPVNVWHENVLSYEELDEIFERGNTEEIVYLIQRYGELAQAKGGKVALLEEPYQVKIAERNVRAEIETYLAFQGFGFAGQNAYLAKATPGGALNYVSKHGLGEEQQRWLLAKAEENDEYRNVLAEHIRRHGLSSAIEVEKLEEMKETKCYDFFYFFVNNHEFSVIGQVKMLETVPHNEFSYYIAKYGLWNQAHEALVETRSNEEISEYIERHRYLVPSAEKKLAEKHDPQLDMLYVKCHVPGTYPSSDFLTALLSVKPLDYPAISAMLLSDNHIETHPNEKDVKDNEVIVNGTHEDVMDLVKQGGTLALKNVAELFFRNNPEAFETYVFRCECFYYH